MQYRYLVLNQGGPWRMPRSLTQEFGLPLESDIERSHQLAMSPATLARIKRLVQRGMTLVGPPPVRAVGLTDYPRSDAEVGRLARELWGTSPGAAGERKADKGRVIWGKSLTEIFQADGLVPDLVIEEDAASKALPLDTLSGIPNPYGSFDWIHRTIGDTEIYFIANLRNAAAAGEFTFRVADAKPELWDPVTGKIRALPKFRRERGCTVVPMRFAPRQSFFVVFRKNGTASSADCQSAVSRIGNPQAPSSSDALPTASRRTQQINNLRYNVPAKTSEVGTAENFSEMTDALELAGPWDVSFDPKWGGPAHVSFDNLDDWSKRPEPGIRHYSGKATYKQTFDFPSPATRHPSLFLDLGTVRNVAAVRLNGRDLGVVWCAPWRVEVTDAIKPKDNALEIAVINLWPNRLIGDAAQPPDKRLTKSNVTGFRPDTPLPPSGLLGPVTLKLQKEKP
jgi:hypothetical protein